MSSYDVDVKKLLEAGAHFGHKTSRWHPRMAPYIHSKRGGTHIIDLVKTAEQLEVGLDFLELTVSKGKQVLLVSTKPQAKDLVKQTAQSTKMPYVTERWLGGLLTNQNTIGKRIKYLKDMEAKMASGELAAKYSKFEVTRFAEEIESMNHVYGGVKDMHAKLGAVFVVDVIADSIAVKEAAKLKIPVVALVDSNADPSQITYPIPCNDDALKTIKLVMELVESAITKGQSKAKPTQTQEETPATAPAKPKPATKKEAKGERVEVDTTETKKQEPAKKPTAKAKE